MDRAALIDGVRATLARAGFDVSDRCDLRPVSFDLVARRDQELLILKVLQNVDALSVPIANEIRLLARFLEARPILVGLRASAGPLEEGVVYNRHDIPIVTPGTLDQYIMHGEAPMVFAAPGGFYVRLDGHALTAAREATGASLGAVAQVAGVSRRAIQMYEQGMSASIESAMRLEQFLQAELIRPIDPFATPAPAAPVEDPEPEPPSDDPLDALIHKLLQGLGYQVRSTRRSPFQALSTQDENTILTGMGRDSPALRRRASVVASISNVTARPGFFVIERTTKTSINGVPALNRREMRSLRDPEDILELILERQTLE